MTYTQASVRQGPDVASTEYLQMFIEQGRDLIGIAQSATRLTQMCDELARQNMQLLTMLRRLEWTRDNHFCPVCDEHHADGHQASCELAALLKEADE